MREYGHGFAMHYQKPYLDLAQNLSVPLWLRVTFLAFALHSKNLHAELRQGQLRELLTVVDMKTGEVHRPSPSQISRAIRRAVAEQVLDPRSCASCLVVRSDRIRPGSGTYGNAYAACASPHRRAS